MARRTLQLFEAVTALFEQILAEVNHGHLPTPPKTLFHYSSLDTLQKCIESRDIRLSHAEYSNDSRELIQARELILAELDNLIRNSGVPTTFYEEVRQMFEVRVSDLDVYIFCMCEGSSRASADLLSQWRAYGRDGRGGALALGQPGIEAMVRHFPGIRVEKVIYQQSQQVKLVQKALDKGFGRFRPSTNRQLVLEETVEVLTYCIPLMKHVGFEEEREWRLFYMPIKGTGRPHIQFHARRDFLAPFVNLRQLWVDVRPLIAPEGRRFQAINVPMPSEDNLLPIETVLIGPSLHQSLNVRAMNKVVEQSALPIVVEKSAIPYRSVE